MLRIATPLTQLAQLLRIGSGLYVSHAASGIAFAYCNSWHSCATLWAAAGEAGWSAAVAFAPDAIRAEKLLWLTPVSVESGNGFAMMKKVKLMFDPGC